MPNCVNCGEELDSEWDECPSCGHRKVFNCLQCGGGISQQQAEQFFDFQGLCPECGEARKLRVKEMSLDSFIIAFVIILYFIYLLIKILN